MTISKTTLAAMAVVAAVGTTATVIAVKTASTSATDCAPNDGLDDRECIQAQIDAACAAGGGVVHLAAGVWNVTRSASVPTSRDSASLWLDCPNLTLTGDGADATTIMMTGDGMASDWADVRISASTTGAPTYLVEVSNMTLASDAMTNPNEQTHLLMLGSLAAHPGTISNVNLEHLHLRHPIVEAVSGDCLRFVGEAATPISFVDVGDVTFEACDRSGVAFQRGVQDIDFHDSKMIAIGKTGVDMEPSGTGPIQRITLNDLDLNSASISGQGSTKTTDVTLSNSHIGPGRLGIGYASRVLVSNVLVANLAAGSEGSLEVRGSNAVVVKGSTIRRLATSVAGSAVRLVGTNGTFSNDVTLSGNLITTEIAGDVVSMESTQGITLSGNQIVGTDVTASGVFVRATGQDIDRLQFAGNRFSGPLANALRVAGNPFNVGVVQAVGNMSTGATNGLRCENPAKFTKPVVHASYYYDGAATPTVGCTGVTVMTQRP